MRVEKNNNYLKSRIFKQKVNSVTMFKDKQTAVKAVKESLHKNADKIALWLTENLKEQIVFDHTHEYVTGEGFDKRKNAICDDLMDSRMILIRDTNQELGFIIRTAFPKIKRL